MNSMHNLPFSGSSMVNKPLMFEGRDCFVDENPVAVANLRPRDIDVVLLFSSHPYDSRPHHCCALMAELALN